MNQSLKTFISFGTYKVLIIINDYIPFVLEKYYKVHPNLFSYNISNGIGDKYAN